MKYVTVYKVVKRVPAAGRMQEKRMSALITWPKHYCLSYAEGKWTHGPGNSMVLAFADRLSAERWADRDESNLEVWRATARPPTREIERLAPVLGGGKIRTATELWSHLARFTRRVIRAPWPFGVQPPRGTVACTAIRLEKRLS